MMHASPLSSASLRSAMQVFGRHFTCFALDNPGFGLSEPLATGQGDMNAQAGALRQTIAALGLNQPIVYGASTGAAVTHAFGCEFPQDAALCMLDTFSHHDTADMLEGYFPDLAPRRDGGHLLAAWEKICGLYLFSPWQKAEPERRQLRDMPSPDALNDMVL
ncbi:MAG: alpha/beta hydrolase, partial [Verrucomicrobiota bacterium]